METDMLGPFKITLISEKVVHLAKGQSTTVANIDQLTPFHQPEDRIPAGLAKVSSCHTPDPPPQQPPPSLSSPDQHAANPPPATSEGNQPIHGDQISTEFAILRKLAAESEQYSAPINLLDWYIVEPELILVLETNASGIRSQRRVTGNQGRPSTDGPRETGVVGSSTGSWTSGIRTSDGSKVGTSDGCWCSGVARSTSGPWRDSRNRRLSSACARPTSSILAKICHKLLISSSSGSGSIPSRCWVPGGPTLGSSVAGLMPLPVGFPPPAPRISQSP
ncbi:hypothetical protein EYF80_042618 [Liparis tanakae]|uniref:Uncharacterized protein n=1 Tax=Liparis tanakae TaxID=230148 RepID=A0A4Z2G2R9_9TELE|nr:hypothetical protein EYF80_042618 [Liparis tanakae]